jgi:pectinesterase
MLCGFRSIGRSTLASFVIATLFAFVGHTAAAPATQPTTAATIRIALAGDSTVTDESGWGAGFAACLSGGAQCTNFSRGGRSSGSFIKEGSWQKVLDAKPDYVLIQFGHNDQPGHADRQSDPQTTYKANMTRYVDEARAAGVKPVLITSISRRQWGSDHHIHSTLQPYVDVVKQIAAEKNVPLIDLHDRSIEVYESLREEACKIISPPKGDGYDGTHLNKYGSDLFGSLVAAELRTTVPELNHYIRGFGMNAAHPPTTAPTTAPLVKWDAPAAPATAQGAKQITVAADGGGDFTTIQEAIAAVADNNSDLTTIHIKPGRYFGQIFVPKSKQNVTFEGDDAEKCILTYALNVYDPIPAEVPPRYNGDGVVILGDGFIARNLTIRTTSGDHGQAMALRTEGDRGIFENCHILGWQDTLLANANRQYFKNCLIAGRVDFIYGASTAVFDHCEIRSKNGGHLTAASTPQDHPFGYVFMNCNLTSADGVVADLGRPWRPYASVTFLNCEMGPHIRPEGWNNWGKAENEKTARYSEYNSTGPGANPDKRFAWTKQLTRDEAEKITIATVLGGEDHWDPTAGK